MGRLERITSEVQRHDSKLYCARNKEGMPCIFREGFRYENYRLDDGSWIRFSRPSPHFIFALSDNWKPNGVHVDWGIEPIMKRLRDMDLWNRDILKDYTEHNEKIEKSEERSRQSKTEDFLREIRPSFAKATNDIRVANMDMKKDLRRKKEKR